MKRERRGMQEDLQRLGGQRSNNDRSRRDSEKGRGGHGIYMVQWRDQDEDDAVADVPSRGGAGSFHASAVDNHVRLWRLVR